MPPSAGLCRTDGIWNRFPHGCSCWWSLLRMCSHSCKSRLPDGTPDGFLLSCLSPLYFQNIHYTLQNNVDIVSYRTNFCKRFSTILTCFSKCFFKCFSKLRSDPELRQNPQINFCRMTILVSSSLLFVRENMFRRLSTASSDFMLFKAFRMM